MQYVSICTHACIHTIIREQVRPDGQINLGLEAEIQQLIYSSSAAHMTLLLRPMLVRPWVAQALSDRIRPVRICLTLALSVLVTGSLPLFLMHWDALMLLDAIDVAVLLLAVSVVGWRAQTPAQFPRGERLCDLIDFILAENSVGIEVCPPALNLDQGRNQNLPIHTQVTCTLVRPLHDLADTRAHPPLHIRGPMRHVCNSSM